MEILRYRNGETRITFAMRDVFGNLASGLDVGVQYTTFNDATNPGDFAACDNSAVEIGTTGVYYLVLETTEQTNQYTTVLATATGALPNVIEIRNRYPDTEEEE